jgi:hypothetical protein
MNLYQGQRCGAGGSALFANGCAVGIIGNYRETYSAIGGAMRDTTAPRNSLVRLVRKAQDGT